MPRYRRDHRAMRPIYECPENTRKISRRLHTNLDPLAELGMNTYCNRNGCRRQPTVVRLPSPRNPRRISGTRTRIESSLRV